MRAAELDELERRAVSTTLPPTTTEEGDDFLAGLRRLSERLSEAREAERAATEDATSAS